MNQLKKSIAILLCLLLLLSAGSVLGFAAQEPAASQLKFGEDGKFTILHLTDTQDDQYPAHELRPFLEKAIETAQPDLIIFTGDLVEDFRPGDFKDNFGVWEGVVTLGLKGKDKEKTKKNRSPFVVLVCFTLCTYYSKSAGKYNIGMLHKYGIL